MKLTNAEAIKALKKAKLPELVMRIEEYPEAEVDGQSDWRIIADEADWLLDSYESDDTMHNDTLMQSKEILKRTENGTVIPVSPKDFKPLYKDHEVKEAKEVVSEYNRLKRFVKKLMAQ